MTKPLVFIFSFILNFQAYGANSYSVASDGGVKQIEEFSICRRVTNTLSKDLFVPTKTSAEWSAFRSKLPSGVTAAYCFYNSNCRMEDTNSICQKTYTCPHGKIRRLKMMCNLEVNSDYSNAINSNSWNTAEVTSDSENGYSCKIGSSSYGSVGTTSLSSHPAIGASSFTYSCQDYDENGGDCSIFLQVECGDD